MRFVSLSLGLVFFLPTLAIAEGVRLETYGDSVTAGFLSQYSVTQAPPLKTVSKVMSDMAMFLITNKRDYVIGHEDGTHAWPARVAERLRQDGTPVTVENRAFSGALSWELAGELVPGAPQKGANVAYFFIGNNDICENLSSPDEIAQQYARNYETALKKWDASHDGAKAYFIPMPRIDKVYETLRGFVWYKGSLGQYKCEDCWRKFFPYCPSFQKMDKEGKLTEFVQPRVEAMNKALEAVVDKFNRTSKGNAFYYLTHAHDVSYRPEYFSVDCYHLSSFGQHELGDSVFHLSYF